jgi:hypothetical protein
VRYGYSLSSRCTKCGQYGHVDCDPAPLETPSHNGIYQGKARIRFIPPATFGEDFHPHSWGLKATKGHAVQSRFAMAARASAARKSKQRSA